MPDWSNESMSTAPLLSIGLFLYNGDRFLEAAIESILNQTFRDFELIISDNCSTDGSEEICRSFAAQDSRIRYSRAEHEMSAGWNLRDVYFKAIGKYFKWATHDDMIQPDYLRLCIDALEADDSLVVAHTLTRCIDESGQFVESEDERLRTSSVDPVVRARDLLLKRHGGYPVSGLIRLDALHKLPPRGSYEHSDRVLLLQLGLSGRFYEVPEHLSICTKHTVPALSAQGEQSRKLVFPEWNAGREFARSVAQSSLSRSQRLKCYGVIMRWALSNLQNRHATVATPAPLGSLDLNPRGEESI
jgi:glycosyltransferase involved in cell wall biosynthesis